MMGNTVLLSESELRAALEPLLERVLAERLRLFQLQLEPRLQALVAAAAQERGHDERWSEGLRKLAQAEAASACFAELFTLAGGVVGQARALLVEWQGEMAVWRQEGTALPAHFPTASRSARLGEGSTAGIQVRGHSVGALYWPGARLERRAAERVALLTEIAGLALLAGAVRATAPAPLTPAAGAGAARVLAPATTAARRPARNEAEARAQRFAHLLIEDLRLYLSKERPQEVETARRLGDWNQRFAPELARCRRAFRERYPEGGDIGIEVLDEETPRLAAD
jgi:hypothetical protein